MLRMTTRVAAISLMTLPLALAIGHQAKAAMAEKASIMVSDSGKLGDHLTDARGTSLYLFEKDAQKASACYDTCAERWPPLLAAEKPEAGKGANASLLGTVARKDGSMQVTYNGWPLYYFFKDTKAGETKGQGINAFGGEWYLVTPAGMTLETAEGGMHKEGEKKKSSY